MISVLILVLASLTAGAQQDSSRTRSIDSLLKRPRGIIGQITESLLTDDTADQKVGVQRADIPFRKYENMYIRRVIVQSLRFGTLTEDTVRSIDRRLTRLANRLHHKSRGWTIRNQLFFHEGQTISPFVLANNERYLRDLPYLQEARILVRPVEGLTDTVDVIVRTKDVLSIGGRAQLKGSSAGILELKEDNLMGWGDRFEIRGLYEPSRRHAGGFGIEYLKRNILGSFIDGEAGYSNFNPSFTSGRREEHAAYFRFTRPLADPFMKWTYSASVADRRSANLFHDDSLYSNSLQYRYLQYDAWIGRNLSASPLERGNEYSRVRFLLGARFLDQHFEKRPEIYANSYSYSFANMQAALVGFSLFRLNFYKTSYIYGFGRKEDLPEGLEAGITAGWTRKAGEQRPYLGLNLMQSFVTRTERFLDYSVSAGGYWNKGKSEDVTLMGNMEYFTRLTWFGPRWKHRSFLYLSAARQFNSRLDEPLLLENRFGQQDFENNRLPGHTRITLRGESVFFSPWSPLFFRMAPFGFASLTYFRPQTHPPTSTSDIYAGIGGGLRVRNESLIFGTMEFRLAWYPRADFSGDRFHFRFSSNLRYKFAQNFIRRPDFIQVNL